MNDFEDIPLYPIGIVLLPDNTLSLHIFETRHKEMVKDCLKGNRTFGLVYYNGSNLRRVGCAARIVDVFRTWPDGRLQILVSGEKRFEVLDLNTDTPYMQAKIRYFDDDCLDDESVLDALKKDSLRLLEKLAKGTGKPLDFSQLQKLEPKQLSFFLGNTDLTDLQEKQSLLESTSSADRLDLINDSLKHSLHRLYATQNCSLPNNIPGELPHYYN